MINPNILNILTSTLNDPSYSVTIKEFSQPGYCNKEELQMIVQQINPNPLKIIESQQLYINKLKTKLQNNNLSIPSAKNYVLSINNVVEKTFTVNSTLNFDSTSSLFTSGLSGTISNETNVAIPTSSNNNPTIKEITSKHVECIVFPIAQKIDIDFTYEYAELPAVILTIDESYKLYSSYSLKFKQNGNNHYTGVIITLNNLKRKKTYGKINITVIGDEVD